MGNINNLEFDSIEDISDNSNVKEAVSKKIELLIAQEELRKKRDKERLIRLEKVKNDSFQKKLQKVRLELEHQEFIKKIKETEMNLLRIESAKVDAEEKMLDEIRTTTLEALSEEKENKDFQGLFENDNHEEFNINLEEEKLELIRSIENKKLRLKAKEEEITRLVNISEIKK